MRLSANVIGLLVAFFCSSSFAQTGNILGAVLDHQGYPLENSTVVVYSDDMVRYGTQTDENGKFFIASVTNGIYKIEARYLGGKESINGVLIKTKQTKNIQIQFKSEIVITIKRVEILGNSVFERGPTITLGSTDSEIRNINICVWHPISKNSTYYSNYSAAELFPWRERLVYVPKNTPRRSIRKKK